MSPLDRSSRSRRWTTIVLVLGAVVFGMVLAGGLSWTPNSYGAPARGGVLLPAAGQTGSGFADLAQAVSPAVVTIRAVSFEAPSASELGPHANPNDPFFEFFFGPKGQGEGDGGGDGTDGGPSRASSAPRPAAAVS